MYLDCHNQSRNNKYGSSYKFWWIPIKKKKTLGSKAADTQSNQKAREESEPQKTVMLCILLHFDSTGMIIWRRVVQGAKGRHYSFLLISLEVLFFRDSLESLTNTQSGVTRRQILTLSKNGISYSRHLYRIQATSVPTPFTPPCWERPRLYRHRTSQTCALSLPRSHGVVMWPGSGQREVRGGLSRGVWD